mmetsp:Transcript_102394/g.315966  ORF Transcript_102394/g.315966 Transcript_102394/m.315966 type:complete len:220 (-) Transcript_102394:449-1108(-)
MAWCRRCLRALRSASCSPSCRASIILSSCPSTLPDCSSTSRSALSAASSACSLSRSLADSVSSSARSYLRSGTPALRRAHAAAMPERRAWWAASRASLSSVLALTLPAFSMLWSVERMALLSAWSARLYSSRTASAACSAFLTSEALAIASAFGSRASNATLKLRRSSWRSESNVVCALVMIPLATVAAKALLFRSCLSLAFHMRSSSMTASARSEAWR